MKFHKITSFTKEKFNYNALKYNYLFAQHVNWILFTPPSTITHAQKRQKQSWRLTTKNKKSEYRGFWLILWENRLPKEGTGRSYLKQMYILATNITDGCWKKSCDAIKHKLKTVLDHVIFVFAAHSNYIFCLHSGADECT